MGRRIARRGARTWGAVTIPVTVTLLVVAIGVALWFRGDLNRFLCDGPCGPEHVVPPAALAVGSEPASTRSDVADPPGPVDPARLAAAVREPLASPSLGGHVGFVVLDPADGTVLARSGDGAYVPASTTKVVTGFAALRLLDPQSRFSTRVVREPAASGPPRLVLVGGGDPYLSTERPRKPSRVDVADLATLADRTADALREDGVTEVTLGHDASLFAGPATSPTWPGSYVTEDVVTPVSALWADKGVVGGVRSTDPAAAAARSFAGLLRDRGLEVSGEPVAVEAAPGATEVAAVRSATVARIVESLVRTSDNDAAEVVLRHLALAADAPATFDGGTAAVAAQLEGAGVDTDGLVLRDGSGLSRDNRISPLTLAQTVRAAFGSARTSGLLADLPVSGFTGTLVDRFATLGDARGLVRAKTGTLTGVHSLAGFTTDAAGRPVVFAVMADASEAVAGLETQAGLDRVTAAIAGCSCG